jgi:EAL domain-containing protein (putative c-di-GMP-specific phosphodiesterase class I)
VKSIINQPYFIAGTKHFCTISVGIVIFHKKEADEALKQAEIAMYEAKKSGRNTIQFYDPKMQEAIKHKVSIENNLKRALQKEEFELFFQPQVNSRRKITGFEALIRWNDPQKGIISPALFIPLAEDNGMIVPIGTWVIKTACLQLAQWALQKKTASFTLSINISIKQLQSKHFVATVARLLKELKFPREKLIFEITESLFMHDIEAIISKMRAIMQMGVHFSIDDFGTGYSSLSAIKKLPLEELKIDQSFIQDIDPEKEKNVVVNTIIGMAKNLNLRVVGEGIETETQFDFLKKAGCNTFQGYLFGKPQPLHTLFKF